MTEFPERKSPRLRDYDYATPGAYFVTICTRCRACFLSEIQSHVGEGFHPLPKPRLTKIGHVVETALQFIDANTQNVSIDAYIIMPNHVHIIIVLKTPGGDETPHCGSGGDGTPPLRDVVRRLKSFTSKQFGDVLWQRSYHDHVIRDERDYLRVREYIHNNPAQWEFDYHNPENPNYSDWRGE